MKLTIMALAGVLFGGMVAEATPSQGETYSARHCSKCRVVGKRWKLQRKLVVSYDRVLVGYKRVRTGSKTAPILKTGIRYSVKSTMKRVRIGSDCHGNPIYKRVPSQKRSFYRKQYRVKSVSPTYKRVPVYKSKRVRTWKRVRVPVTVFKCTQ